MIGPLDQSERAGTKILRDESGRQKLVLPGVKVTVVEGPDRGLEAVARRGRMIVGTTPDADLVLRDEAISRRHLEIRITADEVVVRDLGSTNGTRVDGVRVVEAHLAPGSRVGVGDTTLRVTPIEEPVVVPLSHRTELGGLIGRSVAMREVFAIVERVAPTDATVLIEGETGTGKELVAEAIHESSSRAEGPFVVFDCGAVAPTLMESELFGHVRGAFTGAHADRRGVFEEAHGGTVFLDELGELPLELQPKLLRALESRSVRRVGETKPRSVDVRVVAATNRNLAVEVNRGTFREDLYFRLAVVNLELPPLRKRPEDVPLLVRHFVEHLGHEAPSDELLDAFAARPWPGNVRELRNAVERALAMGAGERKGSAPGETAGEDRIPTFLLDMPYKDAVERHTAHFERAYLEHALARSGNSVSGAARLAGLHRRYVQRLMKKHGLREDGET